MDGVLKQMHHMAVPALYQAYVRYVPHAHNEPIIEEVKKILFELYMLSNI
jgi:hypothetical protein